MSNKIIKRKVVGREKLKNLFNAEDVYIAGDEGLEPYQIYEPESYKDGPEGFIKWCEENVFIPIYPVGTMMAVWQLMGRLPREVSPRTGRSYHDLWEAQKEICRQALRMREGEFVYKLIVLCWMRGEGKSLLACLIQLWKFFNWTKQQIVLGANSRDQVTFVHYDIIKDIINHSPNLLQAVGKRNILEKKIRLVDDEGNVEGSVIRAISSFSGIVSNITGYTFSEIFDMKNPKFFVQLDGSIRNIPNALGVIDSTVSSKQHVLYNLFEGFVKRETKTVYFSYRFSREGIHEDYWNPNMDQGQLDDYRRKFPLGEYDRYFKNTWGSASSRIFTEEMIEAVQYVGIDGLIGNNIELLKTLAHKVKIEGSMRSLIEDRGIMRDLEEERNQLKRIIPRLMPLENYYALKDLSGFPIMATFDDLDSLGHIFDTRWAILASIDRADPMKITNRGARTIFTCIAKGLPGSASRPFLMDDHQNVPNYIYFVLHVINVEKHSLEELKEILLLCKKEYDGIDRLCGERWGIWDMVSWCEENDIILEAVFPSYDKQRVSFTELYMTIANARFKCPPLGIWGSKEGDLFREEASVFYHDPDKHWFGSPEKMERNGIQDDLMFSLAWAIYGGRGLNVNDFKERRSDYWFGTMVQERSAIHF